MTRSLIGTLRTFALVAALGAVWLLPQEAAAGGDRFFLRLGDKAGFTLVLGHGARIELAKPHDRSRHERRHWSPSATDREERRLARERDRFLEEAKDAIEKGRYRRAERLLAKAVRAEHRRERYHDRLADRYWRDYRRSGRHKGRPRH
jgi:hypothetical protein